MSSETENKPRPRRPSGKPPGSAWGRSLLALLALLIVVTVLGVGYSWYWLRQPPSKVVSAAEEALFDGNLAAVAAIDVERIMMLRRVWFGELDPEAIPIDDSRRDTWERLFSGPARFGENLEYVLYAVHFNPGQDSASTVALLRGEFDAEAVKAGLSPEYDIERIDEHRWSMTKRASSRAVDSSCEKDEEEQVAPKSFYLTFSPDWILFTEDLEHGERMWERLLSGHSASQDLISWRSYRKGRLASFMALQPARASRVLGGMTGSLARGAASQSPELQAVAAGVEVAPLNGGLNVNMLLVSGDAAWNSATRALIQNRLDQWRKEAGAVTPSLAALLSRVSVAGGQDAVDIDVGIDYRVLSEASRIVEEAIGSLFTPQISAGADGGVVEEQLVTDPRRYVDLDLSSLPALESDPNSAPPLFHQGPFAVDVKSIRGNTDGLLELWIEGKMGLPDNNDRRFNGIGELSLAVTSVQGAEGRELLRDEVCLDASDLSGRSPNRAPETNASHHQDHAWVWKHVRLRPRSNIEDIERITGWLRFEMPTRVREFDVAAAPGQVIEHAGLRLYLRRVKGGTVNYQVSGDVDRLVEVRALNRDGQVLRSGWAVRSDDDRRISQSFAGEVQGLRIFVAEAYFVREVDFTLTDLLKVPGAPDDPSPRWLAPERIPESLWSGYRRLDYGKLEIDPKKEWGIRNKEMTTVAQAQWPPVKLFVTPKSYDWSSGPDAHLYYPMLEGLPGVLSALSYRVASSAESGDSTRAQETFVPIRYPYYSDSGKIAVSQQISGKPIAVTNFVIPQPEGSPRVEGEIIFRLPTATSSTRFALDSLWEGRTQEGLTITLTEVSRGMFPGYGIKIEGEVDKLVNLHGLSAAGGRVGASPINFQSGGYWTMTLPFERNIVAVELVTASSQKVHRYPFDFRIE